MLTSALSLGSVSFSRKIQFNVQPGSVPKGSPMSDPLKSSNVACYLTAAAERAPSKTAVLYPVGREGSGRIAYNAMTFQQLDEESDRYAHGLRNIGIGRGCRVLLMVPPRIEFLALTFALFKIGAVLILIDPGMRKGHLLQCIREVEPQALVAVPLAHPPTAGA